MWRFFVSKRKNDILLIKQRTELKGSAAHSNKVRFIRLRPHVCEDPRTQVAMHILMLNHSLAKMFAMILVKNSNVIEMDPLFMVLSLQRLRMVPSPLLQIH